MIRHVKSAEDLPSKTVKIISRAEAFEKLVAAGVTKGTNTQMLNVWVNDEQTQLDAYKVTGGPISTRGLYFRETDIDLFIAFKTMNFRDFKKMYNNKEVEVSQKGQGDQVLSGQTSLFEDEKGFSYEGNLVKKENGRYTMKGTNFLEFTSGEPLEYWDKKAKRWFSSRIEHNGDDYYIYDLGRSVPIENIKVRVR